MRLEARSPLKPRVGDFLFAAGLFRAHLGVHGGTCASSAGLLPGERWTAAGGVLNGPGVRRVVGGRRGWLDLGASLPTFGHMVEDITSESSTPAASSFVPLTFEQVRVLGCLIEKENTTPDAYPLTLNSLTLACNQTTNREPVTSLLETQVLEALEGLKARKFAFQVTLVGARVQKFKHNLAGKLPHLEKPEIAILCVLLLRGAQTVGELRQRTERLYDFPDLPGLEATMQSMMKNEHGEPLVVCFPPGSGRKSSLYLHTLAGVPEVPVTGAKAEIASFEPVSGAVREDHLLWRARIEDELKALREELRSLKEKLGEP